MKKRVRLTEDDLHRIIEESVNKVLKEESLLDNNAPDYGSVGRQLGELMHNALQNDKQVFVPCVDEIIKAYISNNQQVLSTIMNGWLIGTVNAIRQNHPKFWQSRYNAIRGGNNMQRGNNMQGGNGQMNTR